jgi:hypothetical protein
LERRFEFYREDLDPAVTLVVDGVAPAALNLSHWPGNRTPSRYRADTTTEMALQLAGDPQRERFLEGIRVVSNNHFDTDGLLSAWAVLHPEEALRHRRFLVDAARAGDFGTFTSPDAVKFDLMLTAFEDSRKSPLAARIQGLGEEERSRLIYAELLGRLPELFYQVDAHRSLWEEPFERIVDSFQRVREGGATIREHHASRLSVVETEEELEKMARFDSCRYHRVLTAIRDGRGFRFVLEHHIFSWFDTLTPPRGTRLDLTPLAHALNSMEPRSGTRWTYTGNHDLSARLFQPDGDGDPAVSGLPLERVEPLVSRALLGS